MKEVVIFGGGDYARIASVYLDREGPRKVVAFTVDGRYLDREEFAGRPMVPFEGLLESHPPDAFDLLVAIGFSRMNAVRTEVYRRCKELGYGFISHISPAAHNVSGVGVGENTFVFEANVLQPFVQIGANCVLWSGNHIGHDSIIDDNCFLASHVVVSGNCKIGHSCFIGVNATLRDGVTVAPRCLIGAGAVILKDTVEGEVFGVRRTEARQIKSWEMRH
jgi:sugar O-acyltransferase (sialic acid O-acetyltransferase NeuD family)